MDSNTNHFMLSNSAYDTMKKVAQIWLPALGALYFGLAAIWGLPRAEEVVGTITVIDTFLGVALGLSAKSYNESGAAYDGQMVVEPREDGGKVATLELKNDPQDIHTKKAVNLQVIDKTGGL